MKPLKEIEYQLETAFAKAFYSYVNNDFQLSGSTYICEYKGKIYNLTTSKNTMLSILPSSRLFEILPKHYATLTIRKVLREIFCSFNETQQRLFRAIFSQKDANITDALHIIRRRFSLKYENYIENEFNKALTAFKKSEDYKLLYKRLYATLCMKRQSLDELEYISIISSMLMLSDVSLNEEQVNKIFDIILTSNILRGAFKDE